MNKDLFNQLPADEQPVALELASVAEDMRLSQTFQWDLEAQLMDRAKRKSRISGGWTTNVMRVAGWAVVALGAVFLLNWVIRSLASNPPDATEMVPSSEPSFESDVRQGRICRGPLALAHNSSVFLTSEDKTGFIELDEKKLVDELRTFAWSPDGGRLAIIANHQSRGDIYIHDIDRQLEYVLPSPDLGYLMDLAWTHDGKRLLLRSVKSRSMIYLVNADGTGSVEEKTLDGNFFETPQFAPDDKSLLFHGDYGTVGDITIYAGLIQLMLSDMQPRMIGLAAPPLQPANGFAWSPDGSQLAYFEVLDTMVRLVVERADGTHQVTIASLPIEEVLGTASTNFPVNLSWTPNGKGLVLQLADETLNPSIYLAHTDGTGLIKVADSASAPTVSADGRCLAYISNDQVFLMDLTGAALTLPVRVAELPPGQQNTTWADKLQWSPSEQPHPPVTTEVIPSPEVSFESDVRQGRICKDPLALAHNSSVFLTSEDKTGFIELHEKKLVDELRTFAWSPDGGRLAIIGNREGYGGVQIGDVYIRDFDRRLEYDLPIPNFGSLVNIAWSPDGKKLILQTVESRSTVYLMNADGTGSVEEISLGVQFFETPQFAPDGKSFVFNGNTGPWAGLIQLTLNDLQPQMASMGPPLQAENSFAWSPDGSRLAYFELMDTETFRLVVEEVDNGTRIIIGSLPVEETAGSSGSVNLSWSPDGRTLVFELANQALKRAIYLAHADGTGLVKVVDSAFAPTISSDGRCLAYISNDQVFLMDLTGAALTLPVHVAELPSGQQNTNRADKLQWRP